MLTDPTIPITLSAIFGTGAAVLLVSSLRDPRRRLADAPERPAAKVPVPARRER